MPIGLDLEARPQTPAPKVSVAVAVYNEQPMIPELVRRTAAVLDALPGGPHEIVLANDGSTDESLRLMREAMQRDARIVVVSLSRNFGHQAALSAALDHATGDVVVLMDGDLQDTPETIPRFLEAYHAGYDVVYAVREKRKEGFVLRMCYDVAYRVVAALAKVEIPRGAGDFSLMSRRVVDLLRGSKERQRYLRGLRSWYGFAQVGIGVERDARRGGDSKYSTRMLLRLFFDGVFAFSTIPLRVASAIGLLAVLGATGFGVFSLIAKLFFDESPRGFTALILAIVFLAGVQLLFLGVIGEYVGRIYEEVKERPHYVVSQVERRS